MAHYGHNAVRVELADGQVRMMPLAWTDLLPAPAPLTVNGQPVRLAPLALRELAAWVAARITPEMHEKLDSSTADERELKLDAAPTVGVDERHPDGPTPALVGQAGPSAPGRPGERQKRGRR